MFVKMKNSDLERHVPQSQVEYYQQFGWVVVGADPVPEVAPQAIVQDAGVIQAKPRKRATKPAEPAPEAANQDLGNDIFQGD